MGMGGGASLHVPRRLTMTISPGAGGSTGMSYFIPRMNILGGAVDDDGAGAVVAVASVIAVGAT